MPGNLICIPIRLMNENPAVYLRRLRMTRQIMFSYRLFISQMSTICFLELSFYVLDAEHHLGETGHWPGGVVDALSTNFSLVAMIPFPVPYGTCLK